MNDPAGLGHRLPGHALIDLAERVGEPTVPLRTSPGINSRNLACSIAQRYGDGVLFATPEYNRSIPETVEFLKRFVGVNPPE